MPNARRKKTSSTKKELSNPFSTGGGGNHFEAHVQASFAALMLSNGFAPSLPCWPISKIKLQGKYDGFDTDDMIVFIEKSVGGQQRRLLAQIKHEVSITATGRVFGDVIQAAWNDFNNPSLFTPGQDCIALITGPLSGTDINGARGILEWARHRSSAEEFFRTVEMSNLSSDEKRGKLKAFRAQLKKANGGQDLTDNQLFQFLRDFHLLSYDLDIKAGVALSLLHSIMSQYTAGGVQMLFSRIVDEVQSWNKNAGALTRDNISEDLREAFRPAVLSTFPQELRLPDKIEIDWNHVQFATELAQANLLGGWNENFSSDKDAISLFTGEQFDIWLRKMRELLQQQQTPLKLRDGEWSVRDRLRLWKDLGGRIYDSTLDSFKSAVNAVLGERDPRFDLPAEERPAAQIHGKIPEHSSMLRRGIAEGLALLGTHPRAAVNCTNGKAAGVASFCVREVLTDADWILWASLNEYVPFLAEAAPQEFLQVVENTLENKSEVFDELFRQEGGGIAGQNYMTGLLWALEGLAWDERYLVRVCVLLSSLASRDPGGPWANRPFNSLVTILLPWLPQTNAPIEKRQVAVKTIAQEEPDLAWQLLLALLPGGQQTSTGSHRPSLLELSFPEDRDNISKKNYEEQLSIYNSILLKLASGNINRLTELLQRADKLGGSVLEQLVTLLSADSVRKSSAAAKSELWRPLNTLIARIRASKNLLGLSEQVITTLEGFANEIAPTDPRKLHRKLFSHAPAELLQDGTSFEERSRKLNAIREKAVQEIIEYGGISSVLEFATTVQVPGSVGFCLASITGAEIDSQILPDLLSDPSMLQFVHGYVGGRLRKEGWKWVNQIKDKSWKDPEIGQFLALLPFVPDTWKLAQKWLGRRDSQYWKRVNPNVYETNADLGPAIDKFIENGKLALAVACLVKPLHDGGELDVERSLKVLLAPRVEGQGGNTPDVYEVLEIVSALQKHKSVSVDDLFKIEWRYLQILERDDGSAPKILEHKLASDPEFFTEMIKFLYHPRRKPRVEKKATAEEEAIAKNVWRLLHGWRTPPGTKLAGGFSAANFKRWVAKVRQLCTKSDRLEVAMIHLGCVLFYAPPDPKGLWIHRSVATFLNRKDAEKSRIGFSQQVWNSRGVHWVDPTGTPERALAQEYRSKAERVENEGFYLFAALLRKVADDYDNEAERIIKDPNHW